MTEIHVPLFSHSAAHVDELVIVLINLASRTTRLANMKAQLDMLNWTFSRFEAYDGRDLQQDFDIGLSFPSRDIHPDLQVNLLEAGRSILLQHMEQLRLSDWGQLGVYLSQMSVLLEYAERCKTEACGPLFVLEDDVVLDATIASELDRAFQTLPHDWQVLQVGYLFESDEIGDSPFNWVRDDSWQSIHAYIVRDAATAWHIFTTAKCADGCVVDYSINRARDFPLYRLWPYSLADQDRYRFGSDIPSSSHIRRVRILHPLLPESSST